jgi:hypothetical protein
MPTNEYVGYCVVHAVWPARLSRCETRGGPAFAFHVLADAGGIAVEVTPFAFEFSVVDRRPATATATIGTKRMTRPY